MVKIAVAPLTGAWIEIFVIKDFTTLSYVAPLTGAWIEILEMKNKALIEFCRSPHGSVD